ncbi:MAG TPA: SAM-dependent methyltransferase [Bacteroidales bacterium]|nr:SAM-dependent methyltransferase [Bacteroidales bacterium]
MITFDYNKIAADYDKWYQTPLGKQIDIWEKKLVALHLKQIKSKQILEIGAGTGHWTLFLSQKGFKITGIDIAKKMLAQAEKKNIANTSFISASVESLPFEDNSIENIVAITVLEFVEKQEIAFSEIFRVLKPNGIFVIGALNNMASLQKKRQNDIVFKNARFFSRKTLFEILSKFGNPTVDGCVYMPNPNATLKEIIKAVTNASVNLLNIYGNFLVGSVKKTILKWKIR